MKMRGAVATMRIPGLLCSGVLLCCTLWQAAPAQPTISIQRIVQHWPSTELYFTVECGGQQAYFTNRSVFTLQENTIPVTSNWELWCPDPCVDCALSVALVFDASSSMAGQKNSYAKAAGNAFIDLLNGRWDDVAVVYFNQSVQRRQEMTANLALLHAAVNALPADGGRALWDGIFQGLLEIINDGVNPCRGAVVLVNGADNASTRTMTEVVTLANWNRIPIYPVALGTQNNTSQLKYAAEQTGGRYFETNDPSRLVSIYQEISTLIFSGSTSCLIRYPMGCKDGTTRSVQLTVNNFCQGSATATKSYTVSLDSSRPVITRSVNTLCTRKASHLQWYHNGTLIPSATDTALVVHSTGTYTVTSINENGCSSTSDPFVVQVLPVAPVPAAAALSLDVFPDPVRDYITVVMNGTDGKRVMISILDVAGRVVASECEADAQSGSSLTISLKEQPSGLYFVTGSSGAATVVKKFVKVE